MSANVIKTREDDEELLQIVKMRLRYEAGAIARWCGLPSSRIRTLCNRVLDDDLKASVKDGVETPKQVLAGYWRGA